MDYSIVNCIKDRYEAQQLCQAIQQKVKAMRMAEMGKRITLGDLDLGKSVRIDAGHGHIIGYRGLRVVVELPGRLTSIVSVDFEQVR